jgi:hypothetical protein
MPDQYEEELIEHPDGHHIIKTAQTLAKLSVVVANASALF